MAEALDLATQLAVVTARLGDLMERQEKDTKTLAEAIESLRRDLAASRTDLVTRGEWEQRNRHVDARHQELGREIGGLRAEVRGLEARIEARRVSWPAVAAVAVSVAALLANLIPKLA